MQKPSQNMIQKLSCQFGYGFKCGFGFGFTDTTNFFSRVRVWVQVWVRECIYIYKIYKLLNYKHNAIDS